MIISRIYRRPRGRPATAPEYAQVDAYDSSNSSNDMSEDEKQYRRMRDLNNAASKRCRVGRKRKSEVRFFLLGYGLMTCFYEYSEYKCL